MSPERPHFEHQGIFNSDTILHITKGLGGKVPELCIQEVHGVEKIPYGAEGIRFTIGKEKQTKSIEIYPKLGAIKFRTPIADLVMKDISRIFYGEEGVTFVNGKKTQEQAYLFCSGSGDIVYTEGQRDYEEQDAGVPPQPPLDTLSAKAARQIPH